MESLGVRLARAVPPARGAALHQIVVASAVAVVLFGILAWIAVAAHGGRLPGLRRLAEFSERVSGLPSWSAVPLAIGSVSLIVAAFGFYWDVSWHIDRGRDPGPFANPAHWCIIWGLVGVVAAGVASLALLSEDDVPRTAIRLREGWRMPLGGALVLLCGLIALAGFPLDDVWHALFGQDVTLWGPTHIQMIGGASLATLGLWILLEEGRRHRRNLGARVPLAWLIEHRDVLAGGAFLLGLSTLQGEFDYGVPQFRQLYHPVLLMLAAGIGLVAIRVRAGRFGALGSTAFFLAVRGGLSLLIGPVLGRSTLHFPLYVAEALVVEAVAFVLGTERVIRFGLCSGVLIGTVGLVAEWGWSHVWMPLPWTAVLFPEGAVLGFVAAVAGAILGSLTGRALLAPRVARRPVTGWLGAVAGAAALVCLALPLPMHADTTLRASVSLRTLRPGPDRWVSATISLSRPDAAQSANWFDVTAWQGAGEGGGGLVLAPMIRVGPGVYRTERPFPVNGDWKALLRLHAGSALEAVPIYLPADRAISAAEVPAWPSFRRSFEPDKEILQREAIGGSKVLQRAAYVALGVTGLVWIGSLAWGLRRLNRSALEPAEPAARSRVTLPAA